MATGSGLDSQLGTKTEATVGTIAAPVTQFFPFNSAELTFEPSYIENPGIMAGARFKDVGQVGIARKTASGNISIPVMYKGFGWWMKHILGSVANPVLDGTLAYKQVHVPAGLKGLSFTAQVGKPQPSDGVIKPRTYNGCKVTDWTLTFADNAITTLDLGVDCWNEDTATALATAAYPASNQAWTFANVNAATTVNNDALTAVTFAAGEMTVTSGVPIPSVITKLAISGKASLATDRYGLGNAGIKKEQLETDFFEITGSFEGEYDATTWETPFTAGSTIAIQVTSTGAANGIETSKPYLLDVIIPAAKITKAPAPVSGPDIVKVSGEFAVYDSRVANIAPIQVKIRSTDSAAW
jgi:tail tube protein